MTSINAARFIDFERENGSSPKMFWQVGSLGQELSGLMRRATMKDYNLSDYKRIIQTSESEKGMDLVSKENVTKEISGLSPVWATLRFMDPRFMDRKKERRFFDSGEEAATYWNNLFDYFTDGVNFENHPVAFKRLERDTEFGKIIRLDTYLETTPVSKEVHPLREWIGFSFGNTRNLKLPFPLREMSDYIRKHRADKGHYL